MIKPYRAIGLIVITIILLTGVQAQAGTIIKNEIVQIKRHEHLPIQLQENISGKPPKSILSPIWPDAITRWETIIANNAARFGLDPDLIAAIIMAESSGRPHVESYMGAVGLMGIMPYGPGFEWRPAAEDLRHPDVNVSWGCAIFEDIMTQSGGDLHASLAAYNGGWALVNSTETRTYAANVLDMYGRAIAAREGVDPDSVTRWTVAVEIRRGYVSNQQLLAGGLPIERWQTIGEHLAHVKQGDNNSMQVRAYAVPLDAIEAAFENYAAD